MVKKGDILKFLKPDLWKILLTFLFIGFGVFTLIPVGCAGCIPLKLSSFIALFYIYLSYPIVFLVKVLNITGILLFIVLFILNYFFIFYLLSCSICWILRKKKARIKFFVVILFLSMFGFVIFDAFYTIFTIFPSMDGFIGGSTTINDQQALSNGCKLWIKKGCYPNEDFTIVNYDWNLDNQTDDLSDACLRVLGDESTAYGSKCHDFCCKGYYTGG